MLNGEMPVSKKQLLRFLRLIDLLKSESYPNCVSFARMMRQADVEENLNIACTAKTIYRDIRSLKNDFKAPIKFDAARNGYYLTDLAWDFFGGGTVHNESADCDMLFSNVTAVCDPDCISFFRNHPLALRQKIVKLPDGNYRISAKGRISYFCVISSLLQCRGRATVVFPAALKDKIRKISGRIWENHLN